MKTIIILISVIYLIEIVYCAVPFKDIATSLCLEASANKGVFSNECNVKNAFQRWILNPTESATINKQVFRDIKNVVSSLCLEGDAKSKQINLVECNNSESQIWTINGQEVRNALGFCLESDNSNKVFLNDCLRTSFQKWSNNEPN
jgi:hypothetical protein